MKRFILATVFLVSILVLIAASLAQPNIQISNAAFTDTNTPYFAGFNMTVNITQVNLTNTKNESLSNTTWNVSLTPSWDSSDLRMISSNDTIANVSSYLLNITNNTGYFTYSSPGTQSIKIRFDAVWNGTKIYDEYVLDSPNLTWTNNYDNSTGQLQINFTIGNSQNGTNSTLTIYVYTSTGQVETNTSQTSNLSSWTYSWSYTFTKTDSFKIVAMVDKDNGIPAWFSILNLSTSPDVEISNVAYNVASSTPSIKGISINVTVDNVTLKNLGPMNYTGNYTNETMSISINGKTYNSTSGSDLTVNNTVTLANSSFLLTHTTSGNWTVSITATGLPDYNTTNNVVVLQSPTLNWAGNWSGNVPNYLIVNETLQLNFTVSNAGTGTNNSKLEIYLFNTSSGDHIENSSYSGSTSSWNLLWNKTFNQTGDFTIIAIANRSDGLPAWWSIPIHVVNPVNATVSQATSTVTLTIKSGDNEVYSGNASQLSLSLPDINYWLNIADDTNKVNITGTANFADNPKFVIKKSTGTSSVLYGFDFTNVTFSGDVYVWFNVTGLGIHDDNITIYRCADFDVSAMSCSGSWTKVADNNDLLDATIDAGLVRTFKIKLTSTTGYFSGYKINETSTSSSTSTSTSSGSSSSGTSGGAVGGGSYACDYNYKIEIQDRIQLEKDRKAEIKFKVTNDGTCSDLVIPEISGIPSSWYTLKPESVALDPGQSYIFTLEIQPTETGNFTMKILLETSWKTVEIEVVEPKEEIPIIQTNVTSLNIVSNGTTTTAIQITNNGDDNLTVSIEISGSLSNIISLPSTIELEPGESKILQIVIPSVNQTYSGEIKVKAGNETISIPVTVSPVPSETTTEKAEINWIWMLAVGLVIGVILVLIAIGGVIYYLHQKEKPKGGLAAVKPKYEPKKPSRKGPSRLF